MAAFEIFASSAVVIFAFFNVINGQVTSPPTPIGCSPIGYNINNLTRADYWEFTSNVGCLNGTKCTYYMSLCKNLPDIGAGAVCKEASVCQKTLDGKATFHKIGYQTQNPFLKLEVNGFFTLFPGGEAHKDSKGKPCNLAAYYVFSCDKNTPWIPNESKGDKPVGSNIPGKIVATYQADTCVYNVSVQYAGACYTIAPATQIAVLSAGSVLVIIFVVTFSAYCIAGTTYNYCKGAQNAELVPNSEFWEELPVNIKEGFKFAIGALTCQTTSSTTYEQL